MFGPVRLPMGEGEPTTAAEARDTLLRIQRLCVSRLNRPGPRSLLEGPALLEALISVHAVYVRVLNQLVGFRTVLRAETYCSLTNPVGELSDLLWGASTIENPLMGTRMGPLLISSVQYHAKNVLMPPPGLSATDPAAARSSFPGAFAPRRPLNSMCPSMLLFKVLWP